MFGSGFGTPAAGTTAPTSLFGNPPAVQQQQQTPGAFSFGGTPFQSAPAFGGGGLGTTGSTGMFGLPQVSQPQQQMSGLTLPQLGMQQLQQPQQTYQVDEAQAFQQSIFQCHKFGDERDSALAALNYLDACWGAGKGYYSQTLPPANYSQANVFYRFKAVGYSFMFMDNNEDGLVVVTFKKPQSKINAEESNIVTALQQVLNRPNITVRFNGTKATSEETTMVILFAEDRTTLRRVPATDLATALCQLYVKAPLENLGVTAVSPKVKPSPEQLKRYLESPPEGIDPRVWAKAQDDNPDRNTMTPTPLIGVEALKDRIDWQEKETLQHHARLKLIGEEVDTLMNRHSNLAAELQQMKREHVDLTHRLISVICRQELIRKQGTPYQPEEDSIKKRLEEMDAELNSPTQYKGRLNELLSQIRLHRSSVEGRPIPKCNVDTLSLFPLKEFLGIQQESVRHLVATTKTDAEGVKQMSETIDKVCKMTR